MFFCPAEPNPTTNPQRYKNIGFLEDLQQLSGLNGRVTHSQTVENRSYLIGGPLEIDSNTTVIFSNASQDSTKVFFITGDGSLTVNPGSTLVPGEGMLFSGNEESKVIVNGGIDTLHQVTFRPLAPDTAFGGLSLENNSLSATLSRVVFENSGLYSSALQMVVNDSSAFHDCGRIISDYGSLNISHSLFSNTSLYANNLSHPHNPGFSALISYDSVTAATNSDAINVNNYDNFQVSHNRISGADAGYSGLGLFYCGQGTSANHKVIFNTIEDCHTGITGYSTNAFINDNKIHSNNIGVKSINFSNLQLIGERFLTQGDITQSINDNQSYEVYSYFDFPFIRYNKIYDDYDPSGCLIYADYSTPGDNPAITFDVRYNCWKNNSIPAQLCSSYGNNATFNYYPTFCFYDPNPVPISITPDEDMFNTGDSLFKEGAFTDAKNIFITLINLYPGSRYSQSAMKVLFGLELFASNDYQGLKQYYQSDDSIAADSSLSRIGDFLANRCDVVLEDWPAAIAWYEDNIQNAESAEDSICAIIDLEDLYQQMQEGGKKAVFTGRLTQYIPKSSSHYYAYRDSLLALLPLDHTAKKQHPQQCRLAPGQLSQNFPNPGSGLAEVYYNLPTGSGEAVLCVTDDLGRIRRIIPITDYSPGSHKITLDLGDLDAGVYQYSLISDGSRRDARKMVVIRR